jgi:proteasome lid subunit RPN8/RPN11
MACYVQISRQFYKEMLAQTLRDFPRECCGLLGGLIVPKGERQIYRVERRYPLFNSAASAARFEADPKGLFLAFKAMRQLGIGLLAIYHSHPASDPIPSRTDLVWNNFGPEVVHLILSLTNESEPLKAWHLDETSFREAAWGFGDESDYSALS